VKTLALAETDEGTLARAHVKISSRGISRPDPTAVETRTEDFSRFVG
jgi:hypothetical protein